MINLREFFEIDPSRKDLAWANKIVRELRLTMEPLVDAARVEENMQYLLAQQDMGPVKKMFKNPDNSNVNFGQLAVMEKVRNVITEELESEDLYVEVKAQDPTAINQKDQDRKLLKNRKVIEGVVSELNQMIGLPPYSLKDESKSPFNGNVDEFDNMGLDDKSDEDVDFFFKFFHRLNHEVMAQEPINFFIKYNEVSELIPSWVNDMLAKYAIGCRVFVNDETGAIEWKYVAPETIKAIMGRRRDLKDAPALCIEQRVSVGEIVGLIGNEFNFEEDMQALLNAVNYANAREYTGVMTDEGAMYWGDDENVCTYNDFLKFYVDIGYIEWKSTDGSAIKYTDKNYHGNTSIMKVPVGGTPDPSSAYKRKVNAHQYTYKAFYLILSSTTQRLYKYGKLCFQLREGADDEYSSFSIIAYKREGRCPVEVAKPYIDMIEKNFKKFEWMVAKAKPPGRNYNYESLVKIAENMFPDANTSVGVLNVLEMFYDGVNEIYTLPEINGQPVGGGANVNQDIAHGLSKTVLEFKAIVDWAFSQIYEQLGIAPLRSAYTPEERDGYNLQIQALNGSKTATGYMRRTIYKVIFNSSKRTLLFTQDIIAFKDRSTIPYKFLMQGLGEQVMTALEGLGNIPFHRYGLFVEGFNMKMEKAQQKADIMLAFQNQQITYEQKMLLDSIVSPKMAAKVLSYMTKLAERRKMESDAAMSRGRMAEKQNELGLQMQRDKQAGLLDIQKEDVKGKYLVEVARIQQETELKKQDMKIQSDHQKIDNKADANIREKEQTMQMENEQAIS
jgi:hypothetical protein